MTPKKAGRPKSPTSKVQVTLRLDPSIVAHFKRGGAQGWQTRLHAALLAFVQASTYRRPVAPARPLSPGRACPKPGKKP